MRYLKFIIAVFLILYSESVWADNLLQYSDIPADVLGSELIINGTFNSNIASWGVDPLRGSIAWEAGRLKVINDAANDYVNGGQSITTTPGKIYKATCDADIGTATAIRLLGATISYVDDSTESGSLEVNFLASATASSVALYVWETGNTGHYAYFDNVSTKEAQWAIGTKAFYSTSWRQNIPSATISGDTSGVLSIISGPGTNGKAYQIANTGATDVVVAFTPTKALTVGRHYRPIVIAKRTVGSGTATYKLTGGTAVNITNATFVPLAAPAVATNTTDKPTFTVPAGTTIQFYQPKLLDNVGDGGFNFGDFNLRY